MTLRLYDTRARAKRDFVPVDDERVTMYVCGPTVYNYAHIGNARPVVVFDVLFRLLRRLYGAHQVIYAANVTDVDDKINARAAAEGVPIGVITARYLEAYHADMSALGALAPTLEPRATETMDAIVAMIGRLVRNNAAYAAEGHVLFDTQAFGDYGKLSGRSLDDMIAGARVEVAPYKRHPADFVLWKPSKPGEPVWESPFGPGRPGWHIECSAMIDEALGLPIDIHGGGADLIFPHHENEIAQGICADHAGGYANYWMHNGFLNMGAQKMSKSLGNVTLVHDLVGRWPGEAIRWALLTAHYRAPLSWESGTLDQARSALDRLYGALLRTVHLPIVEGCDAPGDFIAAINDDLNTPAAFSDLFAVASAMERALREGDDETAAIGKSRLLAAGNMIGFLQADPEDWFKSGVDADLAKRVEALLADRIRARLEKDFVRADAIRAELTDLNIEVMDSATGAAWRMRESA